MAGQAQYQELARQLSGVGAVKRDLARILPPECPAGSAGVLTLLDRHGDLRMSALSELLAVDMSVTSRHAAHLADRGWIERSPDPADKRSRILRLTPEGHAILAELNRRSSDLLAERLGDWTDDEVGQLIGLMTRLRASFGDCRAAPHRTLSVPGREPAREALPEPAREAAREALPEAAREPTREPPPGPTTRTPAPTA